VPAFDVVSGAVVRAIIAESREVIADVVKETYFMHDDGTATNPDSYFLRFAHRPNARIIALPAYLGGEVTTAGIKWIGSFPDNIEHNLQRASAVLLLNDGRSGYPYACLEASRISSARTAASAVIAAEALHGGRVAGGITIVGAGVIARTIVEFFRAGGWRVDRFSVYDTVPGYTELLADFIDANGYQAERHTDLDAACATSEIVVFATTAAEPHVTRLDAFWPDQTVLNISLRDIGPEIIAAAHNVVDAVDHCLKANTSPHLAAQTLGHHDFIDGTLAQLLRGEITLTAAKPRIFSPFGLGVLDLAVGRYVYRTAIERGQTHAIPDFFDETERWLSAADAPAVPFTDLRQPSTAGVTRPVD
jgi:2,3-diaminopropionate biosynthesis protein SbnB